MSEQEKKHQIIYDLLKAETIPNFLCLPHTKQRKIFTEKEFFLRKSGSGVLNNKWKEDFLSVLAPAILKDPHNINKKAL